MLQTLVALSGAVALLLWGTHMVQTGVQRAFGPSLRTFLGHALRHRINGFFAGLGVTAVLQSSTATGLIVSGFAAAGLVELLPALGVMLGANVGTTLIVQVLSFDMSAAAPALVLIGVVLFRRYKTMPLHDVGRIFIGLGLMLISLHALLQAISPYEDAPGLRTALDFVGTIPLLALLFAAVMTWLMHSSVAVILVVVSLASKGVVGPETALAFVLGANLGTAVNPVIEGASGSGLESKRLPVGNLLARSVGALCCLVVLKPISYLFIKWGLDAGHAVADFHTIFNVILALVLMPFLAPYSRFLTRILPARTNPADPALPRFLDPSAFETPMVALSAATREALRIVETVDTLLVRTSDCLLSGKLNVLAENKKLSENAQSLGHAIQAYLTRLDREDLGPQERHRLSAIFMFVDNLSCAATSVEKGLQRLARTRANKGLRTDPSDRNYQDLVIGRIRANVRSAAALLQNGDRGDSDYPDRTDARDERDNCDDRDLATSLAEEKRVFRKLESQANRLHFEQLRAGTPDCAFRVDLIRELKMINAYLVASAAYPALEQASDAVISNPTPDAEAPVLPAVHVPEQHGPRRPSRSQVTV